MVNVRLRNGFGPCQIEMPRRECRRASTDYAWAILEMLAPWEEDYLNCASILAQGIEFILWLKVNRPWSCFAGDKTTQPKDIRRARGYLKDYRGRPNA
jgi:hypothetical protein